MKIKVLSLLFAVILITNLYGCSEPGMGETSIEMETGNEALSTAVPEETAYTILLEEGKQYLQLDRGLVHGFISNDLESSYYIEYPSFSSLSEMKQSIESGNLSEKTLEAIYRGNDRNTKIEIFNLDELYDVSLPGNMEYESVLWCGKRYEFRIFGDGHSSGIVLGDEASYDYAFRAEYEDNFGTEQTVIAEGDVEDRNATMLHYKNDTGEYKRLHYQVGTGSNVIYVTEEYVVDYYNDEIFNGQESDTVPFWVHVFGTVDGIPWWGTFEGLGERPDVEWFTEIRFEKAAQTNY